MNTDERIHAYCRNPDTVNDINIDIYLEDKQMHAAGACARQHGPVRALDPQQHSDVFAGRALQPRGRGNRAQGAARIDPAVRSANIDLAATYTEAFVDKVPPR